MVEITEDELLEYGLSKKESVRLREEILSILQKYLTNEDRWQNLRQKILNTSHDFLIHKLVFSRLYPEFKDHPETAPLIIPSEKQVANSNIFNFMKERDIDTIESFHDYSVKCYESFWHAVLLKLNIVFRKAPTSICDLSNGYELPLWLPNARMNIVDSCFNATANDIAVYEYHNNEITKYTFLQLESFVNQIANSLEALGFKPKDRIAIMMPMNYFAVAIYLAIIKIGATAVGIADSFSSNEIETRMHIADCDTIFTQDFILWGGKKINLYEKIINTKIKTAIILPLDEKIEIPIRDQDIEWRKFLLENKFYQAAYASTPQTACNILFSSGTTGDPKAIIWNHTTPIKCASDAFLHQNIKPNDVLCWPTNLGWMMGPWLIFAAFINRAAVALYPEVPKSRQFGEFVRDAKVTMLGVVPTMVAYWRQTKCMEGLDWSNIKVFTSTGECSNPEDMFYLMYLANYKPVIEYCGGTEIGGAYLSSTVMQKNYPALFSTAAMGIDFCILDESGKKSDFGQVAIIPPSIGLSTDLLNADHHAVYYANMPSIQNIPLRRHGDELKQFANGYYTILGRSDDTMNLGGIKISAVEIERCLSNIPGIIEVAAIATNRKGPSQLVIFAATKDHTLDKIEVKHLMQSQINSHLNPLFKINDVVFIEDLPKTASNKIMRRELRKNYCHSIE